LVIFGAIVGWIASILVGRSSKMGCGANVVVGILGSIIGGFVLEQQCLNFTNLVIGAVAVTLVLALKDYQAIPLGCLYGLLGVLAAINVLGMFYICKTTLGIYAHNRRARLLLAKYAQELIAVQEDPDLKGPSWGRFRNRLSIQFLVHAILVLFLVGVAWFIA
jgi:uncharacterized membrane protein YeaQ/YmgE (transglycosylase-associated protein family)